VPKFASLQEWANRVQHETISTGKLDKELRQLITQWPKLVRYGEDSR
jgi:hypothetical protein